MDSGITAVFINASFQNRDGGLGALLLRQLREVGEEFGSVVCARQVEDVVDLVVAELDVSRGGHFVRELIFYTLKYVGPVVLRWVRCLVQTQTYIAWLRC